MVGEQLLEALRDGLLLDRRESVGAGRVDAEQAGELRLALEQVGGVDEREQLGRLVPAGPRGVLLDLADDLGQGVLLRQGRSSVHLGSGAFGSLTQAFTSLMASSSVVTLTSRILSGS